MDIYIATKFGNKTGFDKMAKVLREAGHNITHDWTVEDASKVPEPERKDYLIQCAGKDLLGVGLADALVLLPTNDMAGAYVEFGMALAAGLMVIVVDGYAEGLRECIFYHIPRVKHAKTMEDVLKFVGAPGKKELKHEAPPQQSYAGNN